MRYAYDEVGRLVNGVMFFFEKGDEEIAAATFEVINASEQLPTGILWGEYSPTPSEVLSKLRERNALNHGYLGIWFTVYEDQLLKELLSFLREDYPALLPIVEEIEGLVFGTQH